jgi:hypothetical protein
MIFLAQQQESQEDVTKDMKAPINYLPIQLPVAVTEKIQLEETYEDQVENRDGYDCESEEGAREAFRTQRVWLDGDDERRELWTLKRANPVFDDDERDGEVDLEEANLYESPSKRSRVQTLTWADRFYTWEEVQFEE